MIETKFKKGDIVFYYDKTSNKIIKDIVTGVKVSYYNDKIDSLIYEISYKSYLESELYNLEKELRDYLVNQIGFIDLIEYRENKIKGY